LFAFFQGFVYICGESICAVQREGTLTEVKKIRILLAKPGLDGHDRGAKVVAQALIEAGFEVIYTGLHQTVDQILQAALQEDPDVIGLSILSGAHVSICEELMNGLKAEGMGDLPVVVGGVVPVEDQKKLKEMGIAEIFTAGAKFDEIAERTSQIARANSI
jgi:methylmalonyl-CoA mutase C-terminal domain/subunit